MKWFRSYYGLDETDTKESRSNTRELFKVMRRQLDETIKAKSPKRAEKPTEQIKLNDKNNAKIDGTNRIYKNSIKKFQLQKTQFSENPVLTEPISFNFYVMVLRFDF